MKGFQIFTIILLAVLFAGNINCEGGYNMEINNPLPLDRMYTDEGVLIRCKRLTLGDWNMDTTAGLNVVHGLGVDVSHVISISGIIRDDLGIEWYPVGLCMVNGGFVSGDLYINSFNDTWIDIDRQAGGRFDDPNFDGTGFNRGYLHVWYWE